MGGGGKRRRRNCAGWVRAVIYFSNGFFTDFFIAKAQLKPHFACFAAFFCKFFIGLVLPAVRTPSQCTHARTHTRTDIGTHMNMLAFHSEQKQKGGVRGVGKLHDMLYVFVCSCCAASVAAAAVAGTVAAVASANAF